MPSPFPGMNPYLEQSDAWEDFHERFIVAAAECLERSVGSNYLVKIEVRLYLHELSSEERRYAGRADAELTTSSLSGSSGTGGATLTAPVELLLPSVEVERRSSLEIRDRRQRRVVTAIELLSPSNKTPGPDRDEYLRKRALLLDCPSHFVEIDLRRGGVRPGPPELPACDYYALVSRVQDRPRLGMWPVALRECLPSIAIPLTAPHPDVALDLQALLHRVYDAAGYGKYIYGETPDPPLTATDAEWAAQLRPANARPRLEETA